MTALPNPARRTRVLARCAALLAAGSLPLLAQAHVGGTPHQHGFVDGLLHPLTGLDHLAAMAAVGLWSGLTAARSRLWQAPTAFAALLLAGLLLARAGWALPGAEPMIAASLLVLGLLVALRARWPATAGAALAGGFALFHGTAHGLELSGGAAVAGLLMSTAGLHAAGLAAGLRLRDRGTRLSRGVGAAIALLGASLLWA
jgi:urease accessory protein